MLPNGWRKCAIADIATVVTGTTPITSVDSNYGKEYLFVTPGDLGKTKYVIHSAKYLSEQGMKRSRLIPKNSSLFTCIGATIGKVGLAGTEVTTNQQINAVIPKLIEPEYLYYALCHIAQRVKKFAGAQAVPIVNKSSFENEILTVPLDQSEQKLIADMLSTWDLAIEKIVRLIEAKQEVKQGLTQNLLFGRVRTGGRKTVSVQEKRWFSVPEDWEVLKIGSVSKAINARNQNSDDISVLSCTKYDGLVDSLKYFDKQIFSKDTSTYKVVKQGQFAYATNHIEEGSIGYQNLYPNGLVSPMYTVFETYKQKVNDGYLYKLLKTETYRRIFKINTNASVDRRGSLRWKEFSILPIPFPSLDEQTEINKVLDTAQKEVDLFKSQLELLKKQKRGLMQKLLTGKWRLNSGGN